MSEKRQKVVVSGGAAFLLLLAAIAVLVSFMVRQDELPAYAEAWEFDIFVEAALETSDIIETSVPSAIDLLTEAGFDGEEVANKLIVAGVPVSSFALPNYSPFELAEDQARERRCLAEAIYHEARNQPVLGRFAVADVIVNRVADPRFPDTICRVVYQGQGRARGCQFSFACDGSLNRQREPRAWEEARALADLIYRGFKPPLTGFATYYHADYVEPYWAQSFAKTKVIGDHVFYRPPGALRLAANQLGVPAGGDGS